MTPGDETTHSKRGEVVRHGLGIPRYEHPAVAGSQLPNCGVRRVWDELLGRPPINRWFRPDQASSNSAIQIGVRLKAARERIQGHRQGLGLP